MTSPCWLQKVTTSSSFPGGTVGNISLVRSGVVPSKRASRIRKRDTRCPVTRMPRPTRSEDGRNLRLFIFIFYELEYDPEQPPRGGPSGPCRKETHGL